MNSERAKERKLFEISIVCVGVFFGFEQYSHRFESVPSAFFTFIDDDYDGQTRNKFDFRCLKLKKNKI